MEHNYLAAEDHIIIHGRKQREEWKDTMDKIAKDLIHLATTITNHNIPLDIIDIRTL